MSRDDWFRHTTWSDKIAAQFDAKLKRARLEKSSELMAFPVQAVQVECSAGTDRRREKTNVGSSRVREACPGGFPKIILAFDTMRNSA